MILLEGCVQPAMAPNINTSTARVLDALGIEILRPAAAGCCGAIRYHLNDQDGGLDDARRNIDAWWPLIEAGAEAIVMNASGCGQQVKEYDHLLARDPAYTAKAQRVSALTKDLAEILPVLGEELKRRLGAGLAGKVVFHPPCTLQHGQRLGGSVEPLLEAAGYRLEPTREATLCCGSAGTYSMLQPELSGELRRRKLAALTVGTPEMIATANIGCLEHLRAASPVPVRHWIELVAEALQRVPAA